MATTYLTQWSRGPQQGTPEYGIIAAAGTTTRRYRETITITWRVYVTADSDLPASPVNPGNLSPIGWQPVTGGVSRVDTWVCIDRAIPGEYGNPSPRLYYETWQKVGAWQIETDTQPN